MADFRIPVMEYMPWQLQVLAIANSPTVSTAGARYIVGASPTGAFAGNAKNVAWHDGTAWHFDTPVAGWRLWNNDTSKFFFFNGTDWKEELAEGDFIEANESSTDGLIPQWDGITGNKLKAGLTKRTEVRASGTADDNSLPSEKAVRDALNALLGANDAMVYKGVIDCAANPNYPAADAGHVYKVSVAGKIGGASGPNVEIGDMILCKVDSTAAGTHAAVGENWNIIQGNIDGAVIGPASSTDDALAAYDGITGKLIKNTSVTATAVGNHIGDSTIHFTEGSIDHTKITNIGSNTHAQIDTHMGTAAIHRSMTYVSDLKSVIYTQ
jgi:hypothetical protein